jgi:hypothetical protein
MDLGLESPRGFVYKSRSAGVAISSFRGSARFKMRRYIAVWASFCALACLVLASPGSAAHADDGFPYTAYIRADNVRVRSVPNGYATDQLDRGTQVEVYRRQDEWCAIRPPAGSFSWVPERFLRLTGEPGVAEVTADGVESLVGSKFDAPRYTWQVKLDQGELVELLGAKRIVSPQGQGEETWYKIAPPAGEFRWVQGEALDREPPVEVQSKGDDWGLRASRFYAGGPPGDTHAGPLGDGRALAPSHPPDGTNAWLAPEKMGHGTQPAATAAGNAMKTGDSTGPADQAAGDASPDASTSGDFNALVAVETELAQMAARDRQSWRFASLRTRAQTIADRGGSPQDRDQAKHLLARIAEFEDILARHQRLASASASPPAILPPGVDPAGENSGSNGAGEGEAVGWLMPVVTPRNDVPRYALTDPSGEILQFVTPAPGVNLERYLRQRVSVDGLRGYVPELRKPHVTAQRVMVLGETLRR